MYDRTNGLRVGDFVNRVRPYKSGPHKIDRIYQPVFSKNLVARLSDGTWEWVHNLKRLTNGGK